MKKKKELKMGKLTKEDAELIADSIVKIEKELDELFNYFGITSDEREYPLKEYREFLIDYANAGITRGFYYSSIDRKAFIIRLIRSINTNRKDQSNDFEKEERTGG